MRRKDREIKDFDEMIKIMRKCDVCRIAINDDVFPYIVPLNFGMEVIDDKVNLYFHCALEGKKLDLLKKNNHVAFEMDCEHQFILYEDRMSCTMGYESVIGHGLVEEVEESDKLRCLKILMAQYHAEDFEFDTSAMLVTKVLKLSVLSMTGKKRDNKH